MFSRHRIAVLTMSEVHGLLHTKNLIPSLGFAIKPFTLILLIQGVASELFPHVLHMNDTKIVSLLAEKKQKSELNFDFINFCKQFNYPKYINKLMLLIL